MTSAPAFPEPHFFPSPEIGFGIGYILTGIKGLTLRWGQIIRKIIFFLNLAGYPANRVTRKTAWQRKARMAAHYKREPLMKTAIKPFRTVKDRNACGGDGVFAVSFRLLRASGGILR